MTYVSDIVGNSEVEKWFCQMFNEGSCSVFIGSQTGSGKSYFIAHTLGDFCSENHQNILLITNRRLLKMQVENYLAECKRQNIEVVNYQKVESMGTTAYYYLSNYDVIVCDEAHYLFSDASFNRYTDTLLDILRETPKGKVCIFMTATPDILLYYRHEFNFVYYLPADYSYIENVYFFREDKSISNLLEGNNKILYFCRSAKRAANNCRKYKDSKYICSESNVKYGKRSSKRELQNIVFEDKFSSKILFATKVLDNGVNIKDKDLETIIIDTIDPINLIQCLGRRRRLGKNDKINVYIKIYDRGEISYQFGYFKRRVEIAQELIKLGKAKFLEKYSKKKLDDIIDNDMTINRAKYISYKYYIDLYQSWLQGDAEVEFMKYMCNKLGKNFRSDMILEVIDQKKKILNVLKKYLNREMNASVKNELRREVWSTITIDVKTNGRDQGLKNTNNLFEELDIGYKIVSLVRKNNNKQSERYWKIVGR